jgi:hypothetical protein
MFWEGLNRYAFGFILSRCALWSMVLPAMKGVKKCGLKNFLDGAYIK